MSESGFHVRIVVEMQPDGMRHIFLVDVHSQKKVDTGHKCRPQELLQTVRKIKADLECKGHQVSVKEM